MIYLDYSANTPINKEVLESFNKVALNYPANPNSLHSLGVKAKELIDASTKQIAEILRVNTNEIIYTNCETNSHPISSVTIHSCCFHQDRKLFQVLFPKL